MTFSVGEKVPNKRKAGLRFERRARWPQGQKTAGYSWAGCCCNFVIITVSTGRGRKKDTLADTLTLSPASPVVLRPSARTDQKFVINVRFFAFMDGAIGLTVTNGPKNQSRLSGHPLDPP